MVKMANYISILFIISIAVTLISGGIIKSVNCSNNEREFAKCDNRKSTESNCTTLTSQKLNNSTATTYKPKNKAQNFSSNASEIRPSIVQTILPVTPRSPGLVTRTTGAIYRALSSAFSSGESEIETTTTFPTPTPTPTPQAQLQSTSLAPKESKSRGDAPVRPKLKHQSTTAVVDLEYQDEPIINDHEDIVRFQTSPPTKVATTKSPSKTTTSSIPTARSNLETTRQSISTPETTTHKQPPSTSKPPKTKLTTTTLKPQVETASSKLVDKSPIQTTTSSQTAPIKTAALNETTKAAGLYGMLTNALRSVYSLNPFLNRTTRVAPEHELDDFKIESGKLMLGNDVIQPATSEDVHLLCKLLHKHLENVTSSAEAATTTTTTATSASTRPTTTLAPSKIEPKPESETKTPLTTTSEPFLGFTTDIPKQKPTSRPALDDGKNEELFVSDLNDLSKIHENHLLESVFAYDLKKFKNNETLERVSRRLLLDLFDSGAKLAAEKNKKQPAGNEYENDEEDGADAPPSEDELSVGSGSGSGSASAADHHHHRHHQHHQRSNKFKMKIYEKFTHTTSDELHLVYWLLEYPTNLSNTSNKNDTKAVDDNTHNNKFKVLNERQVGQLIDQLEHAFIERNLVEANLRPVILIAPFKLTKDGKNKHEHEVEPHIIDDTLGEQQANNGVEREQSTKGDEASKKNAFQLLLSKFTGSNFSDNLQFFLIIFILLLMCIILCFACPLFCFKRSSSSSTRSKNLPSDLSGRSSSTKRANQRKSDNLKRKRSRMDESETENQAAHHRKVSTIEGNLMRDPGLISSQDLAVTAEKKTAANDAIWRKLSNTTTTFVKDQSEVIMVRDNDGTVGVPVSRDDTKTISLPKNEEEGEEEGVKKSQFEWYSFEDHHQSEKKRKTKPDLLGNFETNKSVNNKPQSYIISDRKQYTKSVQTIFLDDQQQPTLSQHTTTDESYNSESTNGYRDRIEKRSSDTLTKSELVMLKEKMIPIARQHQQHYRQVASQTSTPSEAIYVNQSLATKAVQTGQSIDTPTVVEKQQSGQQQRQCQQQVADDHVRQGRHSQSTSSSDDNNKDQNDKDKKRTPPLDRVVSSFIDSQESRSESGANKPSTIIERVIVEKQEQDRIPKMRHLDLAPRTRSKVDAIKAELSKLEQRDCEIPITNIKSSISGKNSRSEAAQQETSSPPYRRF